MPTITLARTVSPRLAAGLAGALVAAILAGGCGGGLIDGVEINGGVADALGLSPSKAVKEKEPKVAARAGLVLPPDESRLPPPMEKGQVAAAPAEAWPIDPEDNKARANAALDQKHKDYCEAALRSARFNNDNGVVMGPKGNCRPGLIGSVTGLFEGERK